MQFINTIDTILNFVDTVRRYANLRDMLSILCWVVGRVVDILTSRRALRTYAATVRVIVATVLGFVGLCRWAYESGAIVGSGYYAIDHEEVADVAIAVSESDEITVMPDGSWGVTTDAVESDDAFINELCAVQSEHHHDLEQFYALRSLPLDTLRSLCWLNDIPNAFDLFTEEAIDTLFFAAA